MQERAHPMWMHARPSDPTRVHPEDLPEKAMEENIKAVTSMRDNPHGTRRVPPNNQDHPLVEVSSSLRDRFISVMIFICLDLNL